MLTRATSHWPTTKGAAGNGLSLSRSIASNSERRLPSRGGANGRLFHSSIFSASAALASASEKNCRWRSGASTHISTSLTAFSADGLSRGFLTRGLVADGASQETLAATGRAQDQNIVVLVQPAAAGEAVDQAAVETARSAVVDILEAGGLAQLGKAQTLGERAIVAFDGLAIDQHRLALVEAEAIAVGQALLLLERLGHAGEAEAAQRLDRATDAD